jgi:WD40 repeat protein/serine/threonine protein kinase
MGNKTSCLKCGAPLTGDARGGFCPKCLFAQASAGDSDDLSHATQLDPSSTVADKIGLAVPAEPPPGVVRTPRSTSLELPMPRAFGDYELLEEIARGGMGIVYRARQLALDRTVAVKMLLFGPLSSPEFVKRFRAEASVAASLQHPNIVAIHDVGVCQGQQYFAMDYVEGQSLAKLLASGPLPATRAACYLKTIAEAIHYAHERGILHRDLKPSNVLIDASDQPRVTDFGLARRLEGDSELTVTGQVLGSPNYMPPEQAVGKRGKVSRRSDVYSLGAMLYHLLTGRPPFVGEALTDTLEQVLNEEPVSPRLLNPSVPRDLETICLKCLEKEPEKRYTTTQTLADDLGWFLNNEPVHARPITRAERVWRWCRRKPAFAGLSAAVIVLLLALAIGSPIALFLINHERLRAEENLYAADMRLAQQALAENNLGHALQLLKKHDPTATNRQSNSLSRAPDRRGWEWRYLTQQCESDERALVGLHEGIVVRVAFSPDGKFLASAAMFPSSLKLWDLQRQREVGLVQHSNDVWQIAFSPKGDVLAVASGDELWFYDPRSLRLLGSPVKYPGWIGGLAFNPDGKWLAVLSAGHLLLLDTDERTAIERHSAPRGWGLAASSDGKWLAIGTYNSTVVLWDVDRHSIYATLQAQNLSMGHVVNGTLVFSPDNQFLASACWESEALIWDVKRLAPVSRLTRDGALVGAVGFSTDSKIFYLGGADQKIRLYDTATWEPMDQRQGHTSEIWSLAVSADGRTIASGAKDRTVRLWDCTPKTRERHLLPLPAAIDGLRLSQDGRTLLTVTTNNTFSLWDTEALAHLTTRPLPLSNFVHDVRTGLTRAVVTADRKLLILGAQDGSVAAWDTKTLELVRIFKGLTNGVRALDVSPDDTIVAAAEWGNRFILWRLATAEVLLVVSNTPTETSLFSFSPDSKALVTARYNGPRAALWNVADGKLRAMFRPSNQQTYETRIARDSLIAATAVNDGTVRLWDVRTGQERATLEGQLNSFHCVAWTPDSSRLAAGGGDNSISVWNASAYPNIEEVAKLKAHRSIVEAVRFLPDGNTLVSVSRHELIRWHAPPLSKKKEALR